MTIRFLLRKLADSTSTRVLCGILVPAIPAMLVHLKTAAGQSLFLATCVLGALLLACSRGKAARIARLVILIPGAVTATLLAACMLYWAEWGSCHVPEHSCRNPGFSGKCLVIIPHEDDELNMMGAALDVIRDKCDIYVLYSTNAREVRMWEAVHSLGHFGIPRERVIFLGYDSYPWDVKGEHTYNSSRGKVKPIDGRDATWGVPGLPCFRPGRSYTQEHIEEDLEAAIASIMPDCIVIVDHDLHADHRALSLTAEKALCRLMKSKPAYHPFVLKSLAYGTCWFQPADFYDGDNIRSTCHLYHGDTMQETACYRWSERLRLPVGACGITRSLAGNHVAEAFAEHKTQTGLDPHIPERLCRGDKVFWWRPTGNHCLYAQVRADSGDAAQLNDFLLVDSSDVSDFDHRPYEHGWCPDNGLGEAVFSWEHPQVVSEIHLFGQANPANQVLGIEIDLGNGKILHTGPLPADGCRHIVKTGCTTPLTGFTLRITRSSGAGAGLAEVEAYASSPEPPIDMAKFQDEHGNFMYDYTTHPDGVAFFSIYTWGNGSNGTLKVQLACPVPGAAKLTKNYNAYTVKCRRNATCTVRLLNGKGEVVDEARISNPSRFTRLVRAAMRFADPFMIQRTRDAQLQYYRNLFSRPGQ